MLQGSEVKSLRAGSVQLSDAFARVRNHEMWILGMQISPWSHSSAHNGHVVDRPRKLLLHRVEIDRLRARTEQDPLQLIPLSVYFLDGRAKLELALARGRRQYDKRHAIRKRGERSGGPSRNGASQSVTLRCHVDTSIQQSQHG